MRYLTIEELQNLVCNERLEGLNAQTALIYLDAACEMIDSYSTHTLGIKSPIPAAATVKLVAADLINIMLNDITKQSENKGDYAYTANDKAFALALRKLDALLNQTGGKERVNLYVI